MESCLDCGAARQRRQWCELATRKGSFARSRKSRIARTVSKGCVTVLVHHLQLVQVVSTLLRTLEGEEIFGHDDQSTRAKGALAAPASSSRSTRSTRRAEVEQSTSPPTQTSERTLRKRPPESLILLEDLCLRLSLPSVHLLRPFEDGRGVAIRLQSGTGIVDSERSVRLHIEGDSFEKSLRPGTGARFSSFPANRTASLRA